jgi:predicted DNA-binding transcriptional regulator AlpA
MNEYPDRFKERRSRKDRRDWNEFVAKDRRSGKERRSNKERRCSQKPFNVIERRKFKVAPQKKDIASQQRKMKDTRYSLGEVAKKTGVSQSQILEWINRKRLNDARIRRDTNGRRVFSEEDIREISTLQKHELKSK